MAWAGRSFGGIHNKPRELTPDATQKKGGEFEFRTEEGDPVTCVQRGLYRIDGTDIVLTSDDPEAV
jgi:hypothetical protein